MSGGYADRVGAVESGNDPTAKNPNSSATGTGQFIDSTWLDQVAKYRPDLAGLPRDQILALRNDPDISREMIGHYADENGARLRAAGLPACRTPTAPATSRTSRVRAGRRRSSRPIPLRRPRRCSSPAKSRPTRSYDR